MESIDYLSHALLLTSPGFIDEHRAMLEGDPGAWQGLPFLDLSKYNCGWATWQDWFTASGNAQIQPNYLYFGNYVYLLEAAAAGKGIALGWKGLIERHLANTVLEPLTEDYVSFDQGIYATLTARGRGHPLAHQFMDCLSGQ
jgi:LysR family glycine cleavage system transcriptional activator